METRIVSKTGNGVSDKVIFEAKSACEITPEKAREAQAELGYHPNGYGFNDFKQKKDLILLRYTATWTCQACCD